MPARGEICCLRGLPRRDARARAALLVVAAAVLGALTLVQPSRAFAEPGWYLDTHPLPTNFSAATPNNGVSGTVVVDIYNVGNSAAGCTVADYERERFEVRQEERLCSEHSPEENQITVTDVLPPGLRAKDAGELDEAFNDGTASVIGHALWSCSGNGPGVPPRVLGATVVTCRNKAHKDSEEELELGVFAGGGGAPTVEFAGIANPQPTIGITVEVQPGAEGHEENRVSIAGGGAPTPASASGGVTVSDSAPTPGATTWDGWFSTASGMPDIQAGSHPYSAIFDFDLATTFNATNNTTSVSGGELRTVEVLLPKGVIGDPTAVPECPRSQFVAERCSIESMIGTTTAYFTRNRPAGVQVFNLVPPPGVPAEFGFSLQGLNTYLDASVRTGSDYGVNEHASAVSQKAIDRAITTLWGDPGDRSHDRWRNGITGGCSKEEFESTGNACSIGANSIDRPFLTMPTDCGRPLPFVLRTTSYSGLRSERTFYMHGPGGETSEITGCENLAFGPALSITPESAMADTVSGLTAEVTPSLGGLQTVRGVSSAPIKNTTVVLPAGIAVNPGQATGLQTCALTESGLTSESETVAGQEDTGPTRCPASSKLGTASAKSPLLEAAAEKDLNGSVYLLASNPPHLKLLATLSGDGVNVKLVLNVGLDERTGQITTRVENAPELPVSNFTLTFAGAAHAAVIMPAHCGAYEADGSFDPWSAPGGLTFGTSSAFAVTSGANGAPCPGSLAFTPTLVAGLTNPLGGGFSSLYTSVSRPDGQQRIERLRISTPRGIAAMLTGIPLCDDADAAAGTCSSASIIGHATVAAGAGASPLIIPEPGRPAPTIYLTGPYEGAPFGLSIVTRLVAGPFDLGTIVTRGAVTVDPATAQVTVTTDRLPQIIAGVPTDLRMVSATIDRPDFIFNPTNCTPSAITGDVTGAPASVSEPSLDVRVETRFAVGGCRALRFDPKLSATTSARPSRVDGVAFKVKVAYPSTHPGTEANIAYTKVDLPAALPSRIPTLNHACLAAVFDRNPADCPPHSVVGHAVVHTPVLPVPLTGPAYFVSHGNEAFPSLTMVLQGYGITIDLVGSTLIRHGVTSTTFKTVPDVPFSTFELALPRGEFSALGGYLPPKSSGSFCRRKLSMPTEFIAQNGSEIHKTTTVAVEGCKAKKPSRAARLAAALNACRRHGAADRGKCEAAAKRRNGSRRGRKKKAGT
jgi:hypothetical protein